MSQVESVGGLLEPIEQSTITELVARRLIALLASGTLTRGDRLPPERELARQLDVGRTTVREALKLLTLGGLLEARRGDGTYVRQEFGQFLSQQFEWPIFLSAQDVDDIIEVREALEVRAARLAALRATAEEIEEIGVFRQMQMIEERDIKRETDLDMQFHHAIAAASHSRLLARLMVSLDSVLRQYMILSGQMTERLATTVAEHKAVSDAIAAGDADAAERAMVEHLATSKATILWVVSSRSQES